MLLNSGSRVVPRITITLCLQKWNMVHLTSRQYVIIKRGIGVLQIVPVIIFVVVVLSHYGSRGLRAHAKIRAITFLQIHSYDRSC